MTQRIFLIFCMYSGPNFGGITRFVSTLVSFAALSISAEARSVITPLAKEVGREGTSYQVTVSSDTIWRAAAADSWVEVLTDNRLGEGSVIVTVKPNATGGDRSTTISIDGQTHTLTQHAGQITSQSSGSAEKQGGLPQAKPATMWNGSTASSSSSVADLAASAGSQAAVTTYGNTFRLDPSFATLIESAGGDIQAIAAASAGGYYVGGSFSTIGGQPHLGLAKFKSDGTIEPTFLANGGFDGAVHAIIIQADGRVIVGGSFKRFNGISRDHIARLNTDGTLDTSFDPGAGFDDKVTCLALQADGRILVGGVFENFNGVACIRFARLNVDGSLDASFKPGAAATSVFYGGTILSLAVQTDGRILVGDYHYIKASPTGGSGYAFTRFNADSTVDATFTSVLGYEAQVNNIAVQADGRILVAGFLYNLSNGSVSKMMVRLAADGSIDASFIPGTGFNGTVNALAVDGVGRILVGGLFTSYNGTACNKIVRLAANGTLDTSFSVSPESTDAVYTLLVQSDGRILVGGTLPGNSGAAGANLVRLTST